MYSEKIEGLILFVGLSPIQLGGIIAYAELQNSNHIFGKLLPKKVFYEPQRLDYKIMKKYLS